MAMKRLALMVALATGCAPSLDHLLAARHHREAICAIRTEKEAKSRVEEVVFADLAPKVHVEVIDVPMEQMTLQTVRLRVTTRAIPVDGLDVGIESVNGTLETASLPALAARTGETLPSPHVVEPSPLLGVVLTILTIGIVQIDTSKRYEEDASHEEFQRAAPRAMALAGLLRDRCEPVSGVAARCTYHFLPTTKNANQPVALSLRLTVRAHSLDGDCTIARTFRVPLGDRATLAEDVRARFGNGFVALR
ncbi:MAG: hypothetical protein ACXWVM_30795 [Polyangiales bacterium]